jgi:hypothetical protein
MGVSVERLVGVAATCGWVGGTNWLGPASPQALAIIKISRTQTLKNRMSFSTVKDALFLFSYYFRRVHRARRGDSFSFLRV